MNKKSILIRSSYSADFSDELEKALLMENWNIFNRLPLKNAFYQVRSFENCLHQISNFGLVQEKSAIYPDTLLTICNSEDLDDFLSLAYVLHMGIVIVYTEESSTYCVETLQRFSTYIPIVFISNVSCVHSIKVEFLTTYCEWAYFKKNGLFLIEQ